MTLPQAIKRIELIRSSENAAKTKRIIDLTINIEACGYTRRFSRPSMNDLDVLFNSGELFGDKFEILFNGQYVLRNKTDVNHFCRCILNNEGF